MDNIPHFTHLSKTEVAGKNHLKTLHSKNISSDEFHKYLKLHNPDKYYYYKGENVLTIFEICFGFGFYRIIYHNFYYNQNEITIHVTNKWINNFTYDASMITYDLSTTYNIYKILRK